MSQEEALRRIKETIAKKSEFLNLSSLKLTSVPPELSQLQSLIHLDLRDNQLTSVPPELGQLQSLIQLDPWPRYM